MNSNKILSPFQIEVIRLIKESESLNLDTLLSKFCTDDVGDGLYELLKLVNILNLDIVLDYKSENRWKYADIIDVPDYPLCNILASIVTKIHLTHIICLPGYTPSEQLLRESNAI
jgi:hypothetical protein